MKPVKSAKQMAWQHEFDLVDGEVETRRLARDRARRAALLRSHQASPHMPAAKRTDMPDQLAALPLISMTRHAAHRLKSRGISMEQVLILTDFGVAQRSHGATRYALDKKSRQLLTESIDPEVLRKIGSLDIVAVFSDGGALVTAAHRTRRLRREIVNH